VTVHTTRGILLRAHAWSETSRILRFLTPDLGIVGVSARGVRRRSSSGEMPLETFALGDLTLDWRPGRELHPFREFRVDAASSPRALARDMLAFAGASFLAEFVLTHALESSESEGLFPILSETLQALERASGTPPPDAIILSAAWRLLAHFGFPPELERCLGCGTDLDADVGETRFDLASGGLRCARCSGAASNAASSGGRSSGSGAGVLVGPGARMALRQMLDGDPPMELPGALQHFTLVERYAILHLGLSRPFRASELMVGALRARMDPPSASAT